MKRVVWTVIWWVVLIAAAHAETAPKTYSRPVEAEIYAVFLNQIASKAVLEKTIVIRQATSGLDDLVVSRVDLSKNIRNSIPEASKQVVDDFLRFGDEQSTVSIPSNDVRSDLNYALISDSDYVDIFRDKSWSDNWKRFQKHYPHSPIGYIQFSRVGYDPLSKQSLLYVTFSCGPSVTCGGISLHLFTLKWGKWVEVKSVMWAIS